MVRFHADLTDFTSILHCFDFISMSLRFHFDFTLLSFRFHFDVTLANEPANELTNHELSNSLCFERTNYTLPEGRRGKLPLPKEKRERGGAQVHPFSPYNQTARTHKRTRRNETIPWLDSPHPPTNSDITHSPSEI